jgi:hypothetical protein
VNRLLRTIIVLQVLLLAATWTHQVAHAERVKLGLPSRSMGYLRLFIL